MASAIAGGTRDGVPTAIVIATFQSAETIDACLDAVARCTPEPHEVIVVDNASSDDTRARVERRGVRCIANPDNRGFSIACNQGIAASAGSDPRRGAVVLLNPDTVVTPGWLGRLIARLDGDVAAVGPLSDYVAADQRVGLHVGAIAKPLPKEPDALGAALAAANAGRAIETRLLIGFCLAMRRDLIEAHGALDEDLFLGNDDLEYSHRMRRLGYRLLVATDAFVHHAGQRSFASLAPSDRERLVQESTDALQRKLEIEYGADSVPAPEALWGIEWFRPSGRDLTSIVIPVWNNLRFTRMCLESVARYTTAPHEVIVVDNGSTDGTPAYLASQPHIRTIRNAENRGFAVACNQGMAAARGAHVCLLNNDVVVTPGWLDGMLAHAKRNPRFGVLGPMTNYASGPQLVPKVGYASIADLESYARAFSDERRGQFLVHPRVTGLCMLLTGPCRRAVGAMDERFGLGNFEDDDYCIRARLAGFDCVIVGDVFVHHFGSQTFKEMKIDYGALLEENRDKFVEKWVAKGVEAGLVAKR